MRVRVRVRFRVRVRVRVRARLHSPERFMRSAKLWWRSRCSARKVRHALNAKKARLPG